MEKLYALTYCNEGDCDSSPYASTIAVSYNKETLRNELERCVTEDCEVVTDDEDDEYYNKNFKVVSLYDDSATLQHTIYEDLYIKYTITYTEML